AAGKAPPSSTRCWPSQRYGISGPCRSYLRISACKEPFVRHGKDPRSLYVPSSDRSEPAPNTLSGTARDSWSSNSREQFAARSMPRVVSSDHCLCSAFPPPINPGTGFAIHPSRQAAEVSHELSLLESFPIAEHPGSAQVRKNSQKRGHV